MKPEKQGSEITTGEQTAFFQRTLDHICEQRRIDPSAVRNVISVGCGVFAEARALQSKFPDARIIGVDIEKYPLSMHHGGMIPQGVDVVRGDLKQGLPQVDGGYDLIVARNPNFNDAGWKEIFVRCREAMNDSGIVIATTQTEVEMEEIRVWLESAGLRIETAGDNEFADVAPSQFKDYHLLIAEKNPMVDGK